jgi:RNA polymerase sigma-70 factor (ECF subfamily)
VSVATVDAAVVSRCAAGEEDALGELYDALGAQGYALARRVTGDDETAAEAVEAAFVAACQQAARFDPTRTSVPAWLLSLVHREAVDRVRGRGVAQPESPASPALLAALPPDQRRVLELAYLDGRSRREIAALLDEPVEGVAARLHAAVESLRRVSGGSER